MQASALHSYRMKLKQWSWDWTRLPGMRRKVTKHISWKLVKDTGHKSQSKLFDSCRCLLLYTYILICYYMRQQLYVCIRRPYVHAWEFSLILKSVLFTTSYNTSWMVKGMEKQMLERFGERFRAVETLFSQSQHRKSLHMYTWDLSS